MRRTKASLLFTHLILGGWSLVVLFPIWTLIVNSFKVQKDIFADPFGLPNKVTFNGYVSAWTEGRFDLYFFNTINVTVSSLILILLLGSMAAYALAKWKSWVTNFLYIFFIAGIMIPIRLGTIDLVRLITALNLQDRLESLIPVYVAMCLPIATFVLTAFIRSLPSEMFDAARVDGASEWKVYISIVVPLLRPALATAAIFSMVRIWNDLWFPLVFIRAQQSRTIALGVSLLFGQYRTDWNKSLSVLALAVVPILILYVFLSREFIKGLTAGAVKG